jgi:threonine aldolase
MVRPGAIYISHPTEYGILYTKDELMGLREICDEYGMKLYLDGARLGYGLASHKTDVSLKDIAKCCDAFYIGGTKVGALFGEAVVFTEKNDANYFFTRTKQKGAHLAKGRILGIQFDELFTDDLYYTISRHAVDLAMMIKESLLKKGYSQYIDSYTNQQFFIIPKEIYAEISDRVILDNWGEYDTDSYVCRITTSWATTEESVKYLLQIL